MVKSTSCWLNTTVPCFGLYFRKWCSSCQSVSVSSGFNITVCLSACSSMSSLQWGLQEDASTQTQKEPKYSAQHLLWWILHPSSWQQKVFLAMGQIFIPESEPSIERHGWWGARLHRDGGKHLARAKRSGSCGGWAEWVGVWGDEVPDVGGFPAGHSLHNRGSWSLVVPQLSMRYPSTFPQPPNSSPTAASLPPRPRSVLPQLWWVPPHPLRHDPAAHDWKRLLQQVGWCRTTAELHPPP